MLSRKQIYICYLFLKLVNFLPNITYGWVNLIPFSEKLILETNGSFKWSSFLRICIMYTVTKCKVGWMNSFVSNNIINIYLPEYGWINPAYSLLKTVWCGIFCLKAKVTISKPSIQGDHMWNCERSRTLSSYQNQKNQIFLLDRRGSFQLISELNKIYFYCVLVPCTLCYHYISSLTNALVNSCTH